jgi:hypothetical protein
MGGFLRAGGVVQVRREFDALLGRDRDIPQLML